MLDDVVGVDDEGRAEGDALVPRQDAQSLGELLLVVGDPREVRSGQALVRLAPREVDEVGVRRRADQVGVAVREVTLQFAVALNFGRADEGEVLRPVEQDLPAAVGRAEIERLASRKSGRTLLYGHLDGRKLITNSQHSNLLFRS